MKCMALFNTKDVEKNKIQSSDAVNEVPAIHS